MNRTGRGKTCRTPPWPRMALAACLATAALTGTPASSGEHGPESDKIRPDHWRWWHVVWFHKDGTPRFHYGLFHLSRQHQDRLPVAPPLSRPEFGYYQPCWRQIEACPRCVTIETMPVSFDAAPDLPVPPAPGVAPPALPPEAPPTLEPVPAAPIVPMPPAPKAPTAPVRSAENRPSSDLSRLRPLVPSPPVAAPAVPAPPQASLQRDAIKQRGHSPPKLRAASQSVFTSQAVVSPRYRSQLEQARSEVATMGESTIVTASAEIPPAPLEPAPGAKPTVQASRTRHFSPQWTVPELNSFEPEGPAIIRQVSATVEVPSAPTVPAPKAPVASQSLFAPRQYSTNR